MLKQSLRSLDGPRLLKREEYDRLVAAGAFEHERVELLHGSLVAMSPQDPKHTSPIAQLTMLLVPPLVGRALVRVQAPLVAVDESEPEPDLAVVPVGDYRTAHPQRAHLVIEVAVSSARKDRLVKAPLYARSCVTEYWLVDVDAACIEVYRRPSAQGYMCVTAHRSGECVAPESFPDVTLAVDAVFA